MMDKDDLIWVRGCFRVRRAEVKEAAQDMARQFLEAAGAKPKNGDAPEEWQTLWEIYDDINPADGNLFISCRGVGRYADMVKNKNLMTSGELPPIERFKKYQQSNGE